MEITQIKIPASNSVQLVKILKRNNISFKKYNDTNKKGYNIDINIKDPANLTIENNELWVGTDGSNLSNINTTNSGTCFKPNSIHNIGFRTNYTQTITNGELQPIEIVLKNIRNCPKVRIFVDNTSVIKIIDGIHNWNKFKEVDNPLTPAIYEIEKELLLRTNRKFTTQLEWIPSHLDNENISQNKKNRWLKIVEKYGISKANIIRKLNEGADTVAENPTITEHLSHDSNVDINTPQWLLYDNNQKCYLHKKIRTWLKDIHQKQYVKKTTSTRFQKIKPKFFIKQSNTLLMTKNWEFNSLQVFLMRI